jgi:addiction module HigA family antidote
MGLSQRECARKLGWSPRKLNEIIKGKRGVSAAAAIELSETLKTTPEFWLNLQQVIDLDLAYKMKKAS